MPFGISAPRRFSNEPKRSVFGTPSGISALAPTGTSSKGTGSIAAGPQGISAPTPRGASRGGKREKKKGNGTSQRVKRILGTQSLNAAERRRARTNRRRATLVAKSAAVTADPRTGRDRQTLGGPRRG